MSTLIATALLVVVFIPLSNQAGSYDPWVDINGDGKIDGRDVASTAASFGTLGDPTRNVTVTNWPKEPEPKTIVAKQNQTMDIPPITVHLASVNVTGYRYVSVFVAYYDIDAVDQSVILAPSCLGIGITLQSISLDGDYGYYENVLKGYEVGAPTLEISLSSNAMAEIQLTIVLYCYN